MRRNPGPLRELSARSAFAMAADGGVGQGLHRPANTVCTSHCAPLWSRLRASRWKCRSYPRHAPHRRIRHRRALALQRKPRAAASVLHPHAAAEVDDMSLDASAARLATIGSRPRRFLEQILRCAAVQNFHVYPKGRRDHAANRFDAQDWIRGTLQRWATAINAERPVDSAGAQAGKWSCRSFHVKAPNAGPSRDWQQFVIVAARKDERSASGSPGRREGRWRPAGCTWPAVRRGGLPLQRLRSMVSPWRRYCELHYADVSSTLYRHR